MHCEFWHRRPALNMTVNLITSAQSDSGVNLLQRLMVEYFPPVNSVSHTRMRNMLVIGLMTLPDRWVAPSTSLRSLLILFLPGIVLEQKLKLPSWLFQYRLRLKKFYIESSIATTPWYPKERCTLRSWNWPMWSLDPTWDRLSFIRIPHHLMLIICLC